MADPSRPPTPPRGHGTFGRDVVTLTTLRFAAAGAGFATTVLAAHLLGATALGAGGVGLTTGTIAALIANGGLNISAIYFLGRRPDQRAVIVGSSLTLGIVAATFAAVLVAAAAPRIAPEIFVLDGAALVAASAILAASIVGFELTGSLLLGAGRRGAYLLIQAIEGLGSFVVAALVLGLGLRTAAGYVLSAALTFAAATGFAVATLVRAVPLRGLGLDRGFAREALGLGLRGQIGNVLQFLNLRLDLLFVPIFADLRAAGIYLIAVRMSEVVSQIASAAGVFLFPAVSREGIRETELTERAMRATLLAVGGLGVLIAVPAQPLLSFFFGEDFATGSTALRITMIAMIPLAISRLLAGDLKGRGRPGLVSISAAAALIATVILDVTLIPRFGIEGAAVASVVAYAIGAIVLAVGYRRTTGAPLRGFVPTLADVRWLVARTMALVGGRGRPRSAAED